MAQNILTEAGFVRPTLPELMQRIGDRMEIAVGPINRRADSDTGQFIGSIAEEISIAYETAEMVWISRFIESATGFALDALGQWMGSVQRRQKTRTVVNAVIYGTESRSVPAGSIASYGNNNFSLMETAIISRAVLLDGTIRIDDATQAKYTIRANGVEFNYTRKAEDTPATIAAALSALVNASSQYYSATANGSAIRLLSLNLVQGFPVTITSGMSWDRVGSPAQFQAQEYGAISVPVGALINPVSAVSGWTGVNNLVSGTTGSDRESDESYRSRLRASLGASNGRATEAAIRAALLNEVPGVTLSKVLINNTMTVNDIGINPKSIKCIVEGGLAQSVGQVIWDYIGAGIESNGETLVQVTDDSGNPQSVRFSRPTVIGLTVTVNVTELNPEETTPPQIVSLIQEGVANYFKTLSLGDDVIVDRIKQYIYANTTGIRRLGAVYIGDGNTSTSASFWPIEQDSYASLTATVVKGV